MIICSESDEFFEGIYDDISDVEGFVIQKVVAMLEIVVVGGRELWGV